MSSKKPLRYYPSILMARVSQLALKVARRKGTHTPGAVARKIYPNVIQEIARPKHLICVTGTNGKTTVSNMLIDFLKSQGLDCVNNHYGSNILEGNITALLNGANFMGTKSLDWGVLEVDEISSQHIFKQLNPDFIVVTNLYRDSYRRNAHIDFIVDKLKKSIPSSSHLILNADDLISSQLGKSNPKTYFSIDRLENEPESKDALINDLPVCPICLHPLTYDFQRFHHLGHVHCESCGLKSEIPDYQITKLENDQLTLVYQEKEYLIYCNQRNITDIYNMLTAISVLHQAGFELETIINEFNKIRVVKSRFDEIDVNGKKVIMILGKDQNPVANTRVFDFISRQDNCGNVGVIVMNQDNDHGAISENIAWIYDTNYNYLVKPFIKRLGFGSCRYLDYKARAALAGFDQNELYGFVSEEEIAHNFPLEALDTIYLVYGTKDHNLVMKARDIIIERLK